MMQPFGGVLVVSALSAFATGALANEVVVRGWERGQLADFGLGWEPALSLRELVTGIARGAGGAIAIMIVSRCWRGWLASTRFLRRNGRGPACRCW